MYNKKIPTLDEYLSDKTNKFYAFENVTECISSEDADFYDSVSTSSKNLTWSYKNGKAILQNVSHKCPHCNHSNTIKHGISSRLLRFFNKVAVRIPIQRYKCNHCNKTFQTDLKDIVNDNANITHNLKETVAVLYQEGRVKLRPIVNSIFEIGNNKLCHQTVQNIAEEKTFDFKIDPLLVSGYLGFDVQWILPGKDWVYRFVLFDTVYNTPIAEKIYEEETNETVTEFLTTYTRNIDVKCISTDLDIKYKPIIEGLGYKHQYCLFHTKMNINKKLDLKSKKHENDKKYQNIHKKLKKELYNILDDSDYENSYKKIVKLNNNLDDYNEEISNFISQKLFPYFKSFKQWTEDNKIDKTTNKIENYFHVTYPKADKRKERTIEGVCTKLNHRRQQWIRNNSTFPKTTKF